MVLHSDNSDRQKRAQLSAALVITELDPGGAEKAFARIAVGLQAAGWNVRVYSLRDVGRAAGPILQAGIPVTGLHGFRFDPRAVFRLAREFRLNPPQVVLSFLHEANIMSRLAARRAQVPVQISGIRVADRRVSVAWPERLTSKYVSHYVAVSREVANVHSQVCGIPTEKISVIYNGVDAQPAAMVQAEIDQGKEPKPRGLETENRPRILFVGRLTEQKAPFDLLNAFTRLPPEQRKSAELVFVGDGPLRSRLEKQATHGDAVGSVQFLGWRPDVRELMASASVLVLPSRWEGLPNVILEAMASRLPVIASRVDGVTELLTDGVTGSLYSPGDVGELTGLLSEHLRNPQRGHTLALAAQVIASQQFTWDAVVGAYDKLMRQFAGADGRL